MTTTATKCVMCDQAWTEAEVAVMFSLTGGVRQEAVIDRLLAPFRGVDDLMVAMGLSPLSRGTKKWKGAELGLENLFARLEQHGFRVELRPTRSDRRPRWVMCRIGPPGLGSWPSPEHQDAT